MRANRLIRRQEKRKKIKEAKGKIKNVENMISNMTKTCSFCDSVFDSKKYPEQLDTWKVKIFDDHAELFCGSCCKEEGKNEANS